MKPVEHLSSWRQIALHAWQPPRDPTVYGRLLADLTRTEPWIAEVRRRSGTTVTLTHVVVKAIARALAVHPEANVVRKRSWVYQRETVDVFVQVVTDDGEDLGGVKITRADEKSVLEIARELRDRSERIRAHHDPELETTKQSLARLPAWLVGPALRFTDFLTYGLGVRLPRLGLRGDPFGGAMVSSIATFGIDFALAPLVPISRAAIVLLVGRAAPRPMAVEGAVEVRRVLQIGATFDHRLLDGALASRLAKIVCETIEDPASHLGEA